VAAWRHLHTACRDPCVIFGSLAECLFEAWIVRDSKYSAVLLLVAVPEGRGADGVDAMA
jgi:hypothetical protein